MKHIALHLLKTDRVRTSLLTALALTSVIGLAMSYSGQAGASTPASQPMNIYYGTTHTHTGADNDHGGDGSKAKDIFAAAKANKFDFVFLTEHSGPSGPKNGTSYYADARAQAEAYTSSSFVGFAGYEYSENGGDGDSDGGHMTGYGTDTFVNASTPGMKFSSFMDHLAQQGGLGGFNHPEGGHQGAAASLLTTARKKVVVMAEAQRNVGYSASKDGAYYKGFVKALDNGWHVAPTCGLDGHGLFAMKQKETSSKKPCRTGVLAPSLTKGNLIDGLEERRIYTTRDTNMKIKYHMNGYWMGSAIAKPSSAKFTIAVSDPDTKVSADKIKKIEVIGSGGKVLASKSFSSHNVTWTPTVSVGYNKYMFIRVFNGERSAHTAVAAPIWFDTSRN